MGKLDLSKYKLIIFDLDGTLADRDTGKLLDGVAEYFAPFRDDDIKYGERFGISTNQGGVGLRYWMELDGFGDPKKYPTELDIDIRIGEVYEQIGFPMYAAKAFRYQSKKGNWSPAPPNSRNILVWSKTWRKPHPGMLFHCMRQSDVTPDETLMVGDRLEDKEAAERAGCDFVWAWDFFDREKPLDE